MTARRLLVSLAPLALAVAGAALLAPVTACEMLVQIDRGLVDAGGDAGCPICSDDGGAIDAQIADGGVDSDAVDAMDAAD